MNKMTIQEFVQAKGFDQVNLQVRKNSNGYPFITFMDSSKPKEESAENIYFSKEAAKLVEGVQRLENLRDFVITETENADGEMRVKLSRKTEYVDIANVW